MGHEIVLRRERSGLGHRNAAAVIRRAVADTLAAEGVDCACLVSVLLTDEEGIRRLNRDFRGIDKVTDVLSFPMNELRPGAFDPSLCDRDVESGAVLLGDMLLCLPRCEKQGEDYGHGFDRELRYLTVHSVLHLLGYDHLDEGEQKRQMRAREKTIMGETKTL